MYSLTVDGVVKDFKFKRLLENAYLFSLDEIVVGQIHKLRSGWVAIPHLGEPGGTVYGFRTRRDAARYMLEYSGFTNWMGFRPPTGILEFKKMMEENE